MLLKHNQRVGRVSAVYIVFKKEDREALPSVVGKVFCKLRNNRLMQCLDKKGVLQDGQAV